MDTPYPLPTSDARALVREVGRATSHRTAGDVAHEAALRLAVDVADAALSDDRRAERVGRVEQAVRRYFEAIGRSDDAA